MRILEQEACCSLSERLKMIFAYKGGAVPKSDSFSMERKNASPRFLCPMKSHECHHIMGQDEMNGGKDMSVHHEPAQSVVQAFRSDVKNGLDERKVQENRQRYDENKLKEKKKKTNLQKFAE